ncbi:MAG: putative NAD/FAD-binding protein [Gammaproteobacteria bacterium]|jgi:predicted NAD/FAD-binding protein
MFVVETGSGVLHASGASENHAGSGTGLSMKKIAIIGSGISGLTAAYMLHGKHQVSVFEANKYIGGHTNTIEVLDKQHHRVIPVDTGFIVFNDRNYPNLCSLFDQLGVKSRESDMSFSVHCQETGLEYNGTNLDKIFSQRRNLLNPKFWIMLKDILRFHKQGPAALQNNLSDLITVDEFSLQNRYSRQFIENYLIPLGASLWSCPADRFRQFPMRFVLEFLDNHGMLQVDNRPQWRTVVGGSCQYIKPMVKGFNNRIFLNSPIRKVRRSGGQVTVRFENGSEQKFDEVILATHADQSIHLVEDMDEDELDILKNFPYQDNEVILHTDTSLLPENRRAWASWNYRIPRGKNSHASLTYNMNMLQGIESPHTYCVSLNQSELIDESTIIRRVNYHHPVFHTGRNHAQAQHQQLIQRRGISYCGAYWGYGFHEDGVSSALAVCKTFDMELAA